MVAERNMELTANSIRLDIIEMLEASGSGHPGGSLSCVDMLSALFFSGMMEYDHFDPNNHSGDRFLLSKGHAVPALYAVYHQLNWISDDELGTLRKLGSRLQGHPDAKYLPAVEACSGSLGQGLAIGCGLALALRDDALEKGAVPRRVFVLCGDGEMQEGSNWEALALASHLHLDNLVLLLDLNGLQIDGRTDEVCSLGDICTRLSAFGWVTHRVDGHNTRELVSALEWSRTLASLPHAIVCDTVKGKGVPFMEGERGWHGSAPSKEQAQEARTALLAERKRILERAV